MDFVVHQIKLAAGARVGPAVKPVYKKKKTQLQRDIDAIESLSENIEYALTNTIVEEQRQTNWLKPENMTRKKLIVLQEVLRRQEGDQDEDDLANLIPMMEQFLIKNGNRDAVRNAHNHETDVVSLEDVDFDMKKSSRSSSFDSNNQHLYESLSNNATNITAETLPHLEDSLICSQGNKEELVDDIYESPTADVSDDDWFVDSVTSSGKLVETVKTENLESAQQHILKNGRPSKDEATDDKESDNKEYENPTYQNESLLSPKGPGESTDSPMSTLSGPAHSTVTRPSFCDSLYNYEENSTI